MCDSLPTDPARRGLILGAAALFAAGGPALAADRFGASAWRRLTEAQWKRRLPPLSFAVLRQGFTEQPFTSPLLNEHGKGTFVCLGCGLPLFRSQWKFDSHTGWPSFWTVIDGAVGRRADFALVYERTEYHCAQCLGHQGHVFEDGPRPTGLRYCNDGAALRFVAA
ncbi:MAG: peptide-methionine (R)-S-oxide reductase MsrB [Caulobacteraceae bacterium]